MSTTTNMNNGIKVGGAVRPLGDGEDDLGRVLLNTSARLRVTRVDGEKFDAAVIKPGGMWQRGGRVQGLDVASFVAVDDVADRPVARRTPSLREHVATDAAFDTSYALHLAALSRA